MPPDQNASHTLSTLLLRSPVITCCPPPPATCCRAPYGRCDTDRGTGARHLATGTVGDVSDPWWESSAPPRSTVPGRRRSKSSPQSLRPPNRRGQTPLETGRL